MTELDALLLITEFIRQAREEMNAELDAMDYKDLARVVPADQKEAKPCQR